MEFSIGLLFYGSTLLHTQSRIACFINKYSKALVLMPLPSVMLYSVPEYNPKQCQWEPRLESDGEQDDRNSLLGSDSLPFFGTRCTSCKRCLTQCHFCDTRSHLLCRFLVAFVDKPDLFHHWDKVIMSTFHNLSFRIVAK